MAYIADLSYKEEMFKSIEARLKRRGFEIADRRSWEVHGPHQDMNYQVFVGFAKEDNHIFDIVLYPKKVYADLNKWWNPHEDNLIKVLRKRR